MALVSIVVLNWRSYPPVMDAVSSAVNQRGCDVEVIVVDNGSNDGSLERLRTAFPDLAYVEIGYNSGFTGGMNAGTDHARGDFVLWQNADLVLDPDYCARAVAAMAAEPRLGALGGQVDRLIDGRKTDVFDACGYFLSPTHRAAFYRTRSPADVVGVSGSCPFFRRAALDDIRRPVGYVLDPWYFTYGEDIDVMLRLNLAGWIVRFDPGLRAWHIRSGSTVAGSRFYEKPDVTQVHHFKNRLATIRKSLPPRALSARLLPLAVTELGLPFYLLLKRPSSLRNWLRGWGAFLRERPRLARDRQAMLAAAPPGASDRLTRLLRQRP